MKKSTRRSYTDRFGILRTCRLDPAKLDAFYDDPITAASGCAGEFVSEWRRQDVRAGCPFCRAEAEGGDR